MSVESVEHHPLCPQSPTTPPQYIECQCARIVLVQRMVIEEIVICVDQLYTEKLDTANREPTKEEAIDAIYALDLIYRPAGM